MSGLAVRANVRVSVQVGRHPVLVYRYKTSWKELHWDKKEVKSTYRNPSKTGIREPKIY